jgi:hypothetical protein
MALVISVAIVLAIATPFGAATRSKLAEEWERTDADPGAGTVAFTTDLSIQLNSSGTTSDANYSSSGSLVPSMGVVQLAGSPSHSVHSN